MIYLGNAREGGGEATITNGQNIKEGVSTIYTTTYDRNISEEESCRGIVTADVLAEGLSHGAIATRLA